MGVCTDSLRRLLSPEDPTLSKAIQLSLIFEQAEEYNTQLTSKAKADTVKTAPTTHAGAKLKCAKLGRYDQLPASWQCLSCFSKPQRAPQQLGFGTHCVGQHQLPCVKQCPAYG